MPQHAMGPVRLLQLFPFLLVELDPQSGHGVLQVLHAGGADDRRGHAGLVEEPGESDLRGLHSLALGEGDHALLQDMYQAQLVKDGDTYQPELVETVAADDVAPPEAG